jgi:CTLH/CRA C-terminal to LisH motif domain
VISICLSPSFLIIIHLPHTAVVDCSLSFTHSPVRSLSLSDLLLGTIPQKSLSSPTPAASSPAWSTNSSSTETYRVKGVRDLLAGRMEPVIRTLTAHCSELVRLNPILGFELPRQCFVELVRCGRIADALTLARTTLAPLAMRTHLDVYAQFKRTLLCFLAQSQSSQDHSQPQPRPQPQHQPQTLSQSHSRSQPQGQTHSQAEALSEQAESPSSSVAHTHTDLDGDSSMFNASDKSASDREVGIDCSASSSSSTQSESMIPPAQEDACSALLHEQWSLSHRVQLAAEVNELMLGKGGEPPVFSTLFRYLALAVRHYEVLRKQDVVLSSSSSASASSPVPAAHSPSWMTIPTSSDRSPSTTASHSMSLSSSSSSSSSCSSSSSSSSPSTPLSLTELLLEGQACLLLARPHTTVHSAPSAGTLRSFSSCLDVSPMYARRCLNENGNDLRSAVLSQLYTHRLNHARLFPLLLEYALWRGLMDLEVYQRARSLLQNPTTATSCSFTAAAESCRERKFAQRMRQQVTVCELTGVLTELEAQVPGLLRAQPDLHFRLVRLGIVARLTRRSAAGHPYPAQPAQPTQPTLPAHHAEHTALPHLSHQVSLLASIRTDLAPLCGVDPQRLASLKRLLLHMLNGGVEAASTDIHTDTAAGSGADGMRGELNRPLELDCERASAVATSLYQTLADHYRFAEVELVGLVRRLLCVHTNSFRIQMCADPIGTLLGVDRLKRGAAAEEEAQEGEHAEADDNDDVMQCDVDEEESPAAMAAGNPLSSDEDEGLGGNLREADIVTLQEVMAFSRAEATTLLMQYGSLDEVFAVLIP